MAVRHLILIGRRDRLCARRRPADFLGHRKENWGERWEGREGRPSSGDPVVTAGNVGDGVVTKALLDEILPATKPKATAAESTEGAAVLASEARAGDAVEVATSPVEVYGDASYGTANVLLHLEEAGAVANVKVQAPRAPGGVFTKDAFHIDLESRTVTCPVGQLVQIRRTKDGSGLASFGIACKTCPLASSCTTSKGGRNIRVHEHERTLRDARARQKSPMWRTNYRATRPKVERKIGHLMRRRHGGRRARMRGTECVGQDFAMLCAAANLHRMAMLAAPIWMIPTVGARP